MDMVLGIVSRDDHHVQVDPVGKTIPKKSTVERGDSDMLKMFRALPVYFGGKRRLLGAIFKQMPLPQEAPVFVDPFLGGGSVSLYAKARGYRILCSDIAERSLITGKSLIENSNVRLDYDDLVRLSMPVDKPGYAETNLAPDVFPLEHARYLDTFLANARQLEGPKRWLALLLIMKHALHLRPMGNFGGVKVLHQAAAGQWEEMNPNFMKDTIQRGLPRHPIRVAETIRRQINSGIISNGQQNEAHKGDVFEFLINVEGDICYMDPPYSGTQSYERALKPLDDLLRGGPLDKKLPPNPFSKDPPEKILPRLFEAADHIPTWILSYGNQKIDLDGIIAIMKKFRPHVEGRAINYVHCTGLAGKESRNRNQELLIVGRK